jgi:hypothetical protein
VLDMSLFSGGWFSSSRPRNPCFCCAAFSTANPTIRRRSARAVNAGGAFRAVGSAFRYAERLILPE